MGEDDDGSGAGDGDASRADDSSAGSASSGNSWGSRALDAAGQLFVDTGTTIRPTTTGARAAGPDAPLLNPAIQRLFEASGPHVDPRSLSRQIVEHPRWYLPVDAQGRAVLGATDDDEARLPFGRPLAAGQSPRIWKGGRAGTPRVAQAFATPPEASVAVTASGPSVREVGGRALARAMPAGADGVVFVLPTGDSVGQLRDDWPLLGQVAASLDLEEILVRPGPGQLSALLAARWYVPAAAGTEPYTWSSSEVVRVYTHPDRAEADDGLLMALDGQTLARRLAGRTDYDGVMVNLGSQVGLGDDEIHVFSLGPDFGPAVVRGVDPRPGTAPLPARTLAEAHLWLDLRGFPLPVHGRELVPVATPAGLAGINGASESSGPHAAASVLTSGRSPVLVQARAPGGSPWRIVETAYTRTDRPGPTLGPVFAISQPDAPAGYLGDGPTQILCAGLLAHHLHEQRSWQAGRWFVPKETRERAARFAGWAHELLKLLPPGADTLPRSSLRTLDGAEKVRRDPTLASRAWMAERFAYCDGVVRQGWLGL